AAFIAIVFIAGLAISLQTLERRPYDVLFALTLFGAAAGSIYAFFSLVLAYFQLGRMSESASRKEERTIEKFSKDEEAVALIKDTTLHTYFLGATIFLSISAFRFYPIYPRTTLIHLASVFFVLVAAITVMLYTRVKADTYLSDIYSSTKV